MVGGTFVSRHSTCESIPGHYCYCKGDKIRSGYITPAFSGAQKWAELLHKPCVLRGPQQRGQNQKWPPLPWKSRFMDS